MLSEIDPAFNAAPLTLRHDRLRAQVLADQRQGLPATPTRSPRRRATRCCCATSTPASSTTRWACSACTRRSSPPTASRPRTRRRSSPRPSRPAAPSTRSSTMPAARAGEREVRPVRRRDARRTTAATSAPSRRASSFGGMLTFLTVAGGTSRAAAVRSRATSRLAPNPTNGSAGAAPGPRRSARVDPAARRRPPPSTSSTPSAPTAPAARSPARRLTSVSVTIPRHGRDAPCVDLADALQRQPHVLRPRPGLERHRTGARSPRPCSTWTRPGPAISNMSLTPSPDQRHGRRRAAGDRQRRRHRQPERDRGRVHIDGGAGHARSRRRERPATTVSLTATIPAATVAALAEGNHTVAVRAQDALGNWGAFGSHHPQRRQDRAGHEPASPRQPNPNNGTLGVQITLGRRLLPAHRRDRQRLRSRGGSSNIDRGRVLHRHRGRQRHGRGDVRHRRRRSAARPRRSTAPST